MLSSEQEGFVFKQAKNGKLCFVGDFEGLYRNVQDPWGQSGVSHEWGRYYHFSRGRIVNLLNDLAITGPVLEVGSGHGFAANFISRSLGGIKVSGMDISYEAVGRASGNFPNIHFFQGDITSNRLPNQKYEAIVMNQLLWYIVMSMEKAIDNCLKILVNPGYLIFSQAFLTDKQRFAADIIDGFVGFLAFMDAHFPKLEMLSKNYNESGNYIHNDGIVAYLIA